MAQNVLITIMIIMMMIAMGTDISWNQIYTGIRKPVGPAIGLFCQFIIMPLIGFLYNIIFQFESSLAAGLLIISCCPGGAVSNLFTYYLDGDVSLSVTMTTISIVVSLGMMPFNTWIYANNTEAKNLIIPYGNIALSLLIIVSPVTIGMLIKWKFPKISSHFTKWGSGISMILLIIIITIQIVSFGHIFDIVLWKVIVTAGVFPITGFLIGYSIAIISRMSKSACMAIAVESGIQNVSVAYSIIVLSFDTTKNDSILLFPLFYGISQMVNYFFLYIIYRVIRKTFHKMEEECIEEKDKVSSSENDDNETTYEVYKNLLLTTEVNWKKSLKSINKLILPYMLRMTEEVKISKSCQISGIRFLKDLIQLKPWAVMKIEAFTDGSKSTDGMVNAFVIFQAGEEVYNASFTLTRNALSSKLRSSLQCWTVAALENKNNTHSVENDIFTAASTSFNKYAINWIKKHSGIPGNEQADFLARNITHKPNTPPAYNIIPKSRLKYLIWDNALETWQLV
ncbi:ileal sodium/bile acid cotransporter-like [Centruroides sculpturatus]|uniref:ileal sodium/bile acid cotransporter-like n=1 Tax=Centruroides sculpturatus TaxID=218467 RepID=UPI000C6D2697|nr:ileal sodium/bile acid cotransporter-like [Centruroides sculpturatus]